MDGGPSCCTTSPGCRSRKSARGWASRPAPPRFDQAARQASCAGCCEGMMMNSATGAYREQIAATLTPVRPLAPSSRRAWMLVPLGVLLAVSATLVNGQRGDLDLYTPLVTWGITALQSLLGLWLLALGFREAVPGRNVSWPALMLAVALTALLTLGVTFITNAASPTLVAAGREWRYWGECVVAPMILGAPFMVLATL